MGAGEQHPPAHEYLFGEHFDNRYVRWHERKAVKDQSSDRWELFNIESDRTESDRTETTDLSSDEPLSL